MKFLKEVCISQRKANDIYDILNKVALLQEKSKSLDKDIKDVLSCTSNRDTSLSKRTIELSKELSNSLEEMETSLNKLKDILASVKIEGEKWNF